MMLATQVRLHDVEDVYGFVDNSLYRSGIDFESASEREELVGEGICILYELAEKFEPQREGYSQPGRFSGYAAQFLPRRLGDAWHKRHPGHRRVTDGEGKRKWVYQPAPESLDHLLSEKAHEQNTGPGQRGQSSESLIRPPSQWAPVPVGPQSPNSTDP